MAIKKVLSVFIAAVFLFSCFSFSAANVSPDSGYGIISKIKNSIPSWAGYISDYNISNSGTVLVYIQDMHCNPEVQKNISEILRAIDEKIGIEKVILEGVPQGHIKQNALEALPESVKYNVVENLFEKGLVSGSELYSLYGGKNNLYGAENWDEYVPNLYLAAELTGKSKYETERIYPFKKLVEKSVNSNIKRFFYPFYFFIFINKSLSVFLRN